ncbi:MAG: signal peptidase I [Tannerellaceae bacterium]|nr:signal peptidase I [Tannerellaceae bacterium]
MEKKEKNKKRQSRIFSVLLGIGIVTLFFLVRCFAVQSFRVSTSFMQDELQPGDFVLVNKLPVKDNPGRNRIILLYRSFYYGKKPSFFVSRCMGMPGDTVEVTGKGYIINSQLISPSPNALFEYMIEKTITGKFTGITQKLDLPYRSREIRDNDDLYTTLTIFEEYQIREELTETENNLFTRIVPETYKIIIPAKNMPYRVDSLTIPLIQFAINRESNRKALFRDGKLFIDGKESNFFTFKEDYYWVLSDNSIHAIDSRHLGIIPRDHIVGNIWFRWYSKNKKQRFKFI